MANQENIAFKILVNRNLVELFQKQQSPHVRRINRVRAKILIR